MFANAHQRSRERFAASAHGYRRGLSTAQRSPRDSTSRSGLCFAADRPRWPRRSGGQRRPRTCSSAHCRLGSEVRAPSHAVTIHSRIRRWNSPPLTTFPLGVVEPTLRADPNAINRIPHRSTAIETALARPPRVTPARSLGADGLPYVGARVRRIGRAIPGPWAAGSGGQPPAGPCAPLHELPPTSATRRGARGREQSHATSCRGALPP